MDLGAFNNQGKESLILAKFLVFFFKKNSLIVDHSGTRRDSLTTKLQLQDLTVYEIITPKSILSITLNAEDYLAKRFFHLKPISFL